MLSADGDVEALAEIRSLGYAGSEPGAFNEPTGVAVDSNGKVWVTNFDSNSVMRIDPAKFAAAVAKLD